MKKGTLQRRLTMALSQLIVDEWRLLSVTRRESRFPVSERAVAFQLGWYLRPLLERKWDIDCEYNRSGAGDDVDVKRANSRSCPPDLIVHRRGEKRLEDNLLVLELKTNNEFQRHEGGSVESVRDIMIEHHYQYGVFLDLGIFPAGPLTRIFPQWVWLEAPLQALPNRIEPVYSRSEDLIALMERG